ncbi:MULTISPECIES: universal stress protein [Emticicia]|uniref:universal stress protein n=1 Tax=Emticicia TaxID=312278 RepID=UPI00209D90A9|nr:MULTISPECIES: universal stress protein [Emticicia]UTA66736.1 universal stress protein [Emticicia sp. 21SJ11W-3]
MKKIICTTDFSRAASKVCRYAAQLAAQTGAELYLLHASHPSYTFNPDLQVMPVEDVSVELYYQARLKRLAARLTRLTEGAVYIEPVNRVGLAADVIAETTARFKPDLLLMSTVGQLPRSSEVIGNVASEMIGKVTVPTMFVPPKAGFKPYENVYVGIDVNEKIDAVALQQMIDRLKAFKAVITIFTVVKDPEAPAVKEVTTRLREMLHEYPHVIDISQGDNFTDTFLSHAHANKADLLVVFPKQHNWLKRWLTVSNTEELVFRTGLPLIAIA